MSKSTKRIVIGFAIIVGILLTGIFWILINLPSYPYGWSHCCLKVLGGSLIQYAEEHDGHFPAGEKCPEASLSLLYRGNYGANAESLRGKTVPLETVKTILERGDLCGQDTCGWHYVEGLTLCDDPRLAIVWDKIGLGHNGQALPQGGHSVLFVTGIEELISGDEWDQFLKQQEELMASRTEAAIKAIPALRAKVRLPSGEVVDHYDASYTLAHSESGTNFNESGHSSGNTLAPSTLCWYRLNRDNCIMEMTLTLNGWTSDPVKVEITNGVASPNFVIFNMKLNQNEQ